MKTIRLIWLSAETVRRSRLQAEAFCGEEACRKAARFVREMDQLLSLSGAYLIRRFVGPPEAIRISPEGKPLAENICFNLSHSGDMAALALADVPVGLDLEQENAQGDGTEEELRAFCLSAEEQASGLPFLDLFVAKEALVKAVGCGLPDDITSVPALPVNGRLSYEGQLVYRKSIIRGNRHVSLCLINHDFSIREERIHAI